MKYVFILIPYPTVDLTAVTGTLSVFQGVNQYLRAQGKTTPFRIELVGVSNAHTNTSKIHLQIDHYLPDIPQRPDLIIIPSTTSLPVPETITTSHLYNWIIQSYQSGSEVASLCTGAFVLAGTGLLDGKKCTTHWMVAHELQSHFPKVKVTPEAILTDDNGIYTSGGAYSFLNLILYLIEKYLGREIAIWASKMYGIDIDRNNQSQFIIFQGQKEHQDTEILKIQDYIEQHYQHKLQVQELIRQTPMDSRTFIRRFKKATHNTPLEYIQRVKIEAAKRNLETTTMSINEIKYDLAWIDDTSFRSIFKKHTGLTPTAYKKKYGHHDS